MTLIQVLAALLLVTGSALVLRALFLADRSQELEIVTETSAERKAA